MIVLLAMLSGCVSAETREPPTEDRPGRSWFSSIDVTPDARWALARADYELHVFDLQDPRDLERGPPHSRIVSDVRRAVWLEPGKTVLLITDGDGCLLSIPEMRIRKLEQLGSKLTAIAVSPSRELVAVASENSVAVWERATWKCIRRFEEPNTEFHWLGFSPAAPILVAAATDPEPRFRYHQPDHARTYTWNLDTGNLIANGPDPALCGLQFDPLGRLLAWSMRVSCEDPRTVCDWWLTISDPVTGKLIATAGGPGHPPIDAAIPIEGGAKVAILTRGDHPSGGVELFDVATESMSSSIELSQRALGLLPDGRIIASRARGGLEIISIR